MVWNRSLITVCRGLFATDLNLYVTYSWPCNLTWVAPASMEARVKKTNQALWTPRESIAVLSARTPGKRIQKENSCRFKVSNYKRTNFSVPLRVLQATRIMLICMKRDTIQVFPTREAELFWSSHSRELKIWLERSLEIMY